MDSSQPDGLPDAKGAEVSHAEEILRDSVIYRNFAQQREEVLRHKWVLSERAGRDVGFETALLDWMIHHRQDWLNQRPS